ncbi:MAG: hypothetical protein ACE5GY_08540 [Thermodesulfobacteriota bacterium]
MTLVEDIRKRLVIPEEIFEGFLDERGWSWHQLARGELPVSFEDIQLGLICRHHSLWAGAFLKEPDTGEPYQYWPYQLESADAWYDLVHSDGAEVGKTREIGNILLWRASTRPGRSSLVGAPEQVHLDEIIDYCVEQMFTHTPELGRNLKRHKKHPHHVFYFNNGYKVYFSPGGFDGTGFRGKHVNDLCLMDEAAKIKNPDIWREFWRAAKPEATFRLYSVPDGDRDTVFYRIKQRAKGVQEGAELAVGEDDAPKERSFRYFNWRKTQQPDPFWNEGRRRFYIELYGGEDSPGYRRNILGEDGDPENAVFPWHQFSRCLKDIPDYTALKVLVDEGSGSVSLFSAKYGDVRGKDGTREGREEILEDRAVDRARFDLGETISRAFSPVQGLIYMGADLGFSNDPTEIIVRLVLGKVWRTIARLQLKGITYDLQADAIDILDGIYGPKGIGLDFGNAGSAVCHILQKPESYAERHYAERVTGFQFAEGYDDMDESGRVIIDKKTDKPRRLNAKELATNIMTRKMQCQEWELPFDNDYLNQFPSHTYREGPKHRVFSKGNDHIIDAERVCTLKMVVPDQVADDFFSSGVSVRVA